jgi:pimeloyl-ACP methyl ester carboxylesterase
MFKSKLVPSLMLKTVGVAAAVVGLGLGVAAPAASANTTSSTAHKVAQSSAAPVKPTIVLVHGAWADASSFGPVTAQLEKDGFTVLNAPNPLRGLASDAANVAAFVNQDTTGPVILVGHSYGGSVITDAATTTPTVKALVYVDAYAPAQGESAFQLTGALPGSLLAVPDPSTVFNFVQYPGAPTGDVDAYVKPALFQKIFAAGLPTKQANVLAASQSPIALSALMAPSTAPAWKTVKSFFFVGTKDKVIPAAEQLAMAARAGAFVQKFPADHLSMLEAPREVADVIEKAAQTN